VNAKVSTLSIAGSGQNGGTLFVSALGESVKSVDPDLARHPVNSRVCSHSIHYRSGQSTRTPLSRLAQNPPIGDSRRLSQRRIAPVRHHKHRLPIWKVVGRLAARRPWLVRYRHMWDRRYDAREGEQA
jgi:hypothetical protein